jgi:hypothetical protein
LSKAFRIEARVAWQPSDSGDGGEEKKETKEKEEEEEEEEEEGEEVGSSVKSIEQTIAWGGNWCLGITKGGDVAAWAHTGMDTGTGATGTGAIGAIGDREGGAGEGDTRGALSNKLTYGCLSGAPLPMGTWAHVVAMWTPTLPSPAAAAEDPEGDEGGEEKGEEKKVTAVEGEWAFVVTYYSEGEGGGRKTRGRGMKLGLVFTEASPRSRDCPANRRRGRGQRTGGKTVFLRKRRSGSDQRRGLGVSRL